MAEIPIERKSGTNWIIWLVLLALAALVAWWLLSRNGETRAAGGDVVPDTAATAPGVIPTPAPPPAAPGETGAAAGQTVSDIAALTGAADPGALVGRRVQLTTVRVQSVVSDRGFWVGSGEDDRVFAVRMEQDPPGTPADGAVNAGQTVTLQGVLRAMPSNLEEQSTPWNLDSTDVSALSGQRVYIEVDSISIVRRP